MSDQFEYDIWSQENQAKSSSGQPIGSFSSPTDKNSLLINHCIPVPSIHIYRGSWRSRASLVAQLVRNPPAMQETLVQFLGWEDPLEKG